MTDRERDIMYGLRNFGWAIVDPWHAEREFKTRGIWKVMDGGPICPVCGRAAPDSGASWPTGVTFEDPVNHEPDCALAALLREDS